MKTKLHPWQITMITAAAEKPATIGIPKGCGKPSGPYTFETNQQAIARTKRIPTP